jgi:hypothetical protein
MSQSSQTVSDSRVLPFDAAAIFEVLASPAGHAEMDGSGSVLGVASGPERLALGSRFRMKMKILLPYRISSVVKEFDEGRLIAWAHLGGHRWRFELEPVEGGTKVTETFDYSTALFPKGIEKLNYPQRHRSNIAETLARLETVVANRQQR